MARKLLIGVVVLVAALLAFAATRPDTFSIERQTTIQAPAGKVFALIDDFRRWDAWSPWEKRDPAMKRTFAGPSSGKGAVYAWEGNDEVGSGRMEIIDPSSPPARLTIRLDFTRPFEAHNITEFALTPAGDATQVTWRMHGPSPFLSKLMQVFVSMDSMVGKDFEAGLANLKAVAER